MGPDGGRSSLAAVWQGPQPTPGGKPETRPWHQPIAARGDLDWAGPLAEGSSQEGLCWRNESLGLEGVRGGTPQPQP